jgi:hypothetical protein
MKSNKMPGALQLTTNMLKNLLNDALDFLVDTVQEFWQQETDFTTWHATKLNILYKGKGDPQDLNNYRDICLKESCTKILSSITSNRLLKHLKTFGSKPKFGMVGCSRSATHFEESPPPEMPAWPRNLCPLHRSSKIFRYCPTLATF